METEEGEFVVLKCMNCSGPCMEYVGTKFNQNVSQVEAVLSSIYNLNYLQQIPSHLKDDLDLNLDPIESLTICPECNMMLSSLYTLYEQFSSVRDCESVLAKKIQSLDRLMKKLIGQEVLESDNFICGDPPPEEMSENFPIIMSSCSLPSVNVVRLTSEEIQTAVTKREPSELPELPNDDVNMDQYDDGPDFAPNSPLDNIIIKKEFSPIKRRRYSTSHAIQENLDPHIRRRHSHGEKRKQFWCSKCPETFVHHQSLRMHEAECDPLAREATYEEQSMDIVTYSCMLCRKSFKSSVGLQVHMTRIHEDNGNSMGMFDPDDDESMEEKPKVKKGQDNHSRRLRMPFKFTCSVQECGKKFKTKAELRGHSVVHTDVRSHSCPDCGRTFKTNNSLLRHNLIHKNERKYKCPVCFKGFNMAQVLRAHKKIHAEVKDWVCQHCGKSFTEKRTMVKHMQSQHKDMDTT